MTMLLQVSTTYGAILLGASLAYGFVLSSVPLCIGTENDCGQTHRDLVLPVSLMFQALSRRSLREKGSGAFQALHPLQTVAKL